MVTFPNLTLSLLELLTFRLPADDGMFSIVDANDCFVGKLAAATFSGTISIVDNRTAEIIIPIIRLFNLILPVDKSYVYMLLVISQDN
jgi:hypothetical protein